MKYRKLRESISTNVFTLLDVKKHFLEEEEQSIKTQLSRFAQKELITQMKRGIYCFEKEEVDEFLLANKLYAPSYISLESALNYYGIIPDVPQAVTSVNLTTSKKITNEFGAFLYSKIKQELFYGYTRIKAGKSQEYISFALRVKALLDYFYIRRIKNTADLRLDIRDLNRGLYRKLSADFPGWVQEVEL